MNLYDVQRTLYPGARIWEVYTFASLKQAREVLQVDPQLSAWDSDSDSDDEESLDVHTSYAVDLKGKCPCSNTRAYAHMDPKDIPEYLQTLTEGLAEDLPLQERQELAVAIYEYKYVLSSGPTDMGRTDWHWWALPIRLPLKQTTNHQTKGGTRRKKSRIC